MACNIAIKLVLWGFADNRTKLRGGAVYKANGVPDWTCNGCLDYCSKVSTDFTNLTPGAYLCMKGSTNHSGVYLGDGKVFESTAAGAKKCLISTIDENGNRYINGVKSKYKWTYNGLMSKWIDYSDNKDNVKELLEQAQSLIKQAIDEYNN